VGTNQEWGTRGNFILASFTALKKKRRKNGNYALQGPDSETRQTATASLTPSPLSGLREGGNRRKGRKGKWIETAPSIRRAAEILEGCTEKA